MSNLNDEDKIKKEESKIPKKEEKKELTVEEKLKNTEDKLLRSLAELENQRNRFEKDLKEAIDFGGFNFARENLSILDNLQRAYISIENDGTLKNNKDLDKFLKNIEIIEWFLAGGININNLEKASKISKKIDISSSLEDNPGVKSSKKVSDFLLKVKR